VVPHLKDVESSEDSIPLTIVDISSLTISSASGDTSQQVHPHMECEHATLLTWVDDSPRSHEIIDFEFPSDEAILDVMASIDKPKDEVMH